MDHTYKVQVSEQEANKVKSLTGRSNVSEAIVELLTLASHGRLQVRPKKSDYAASLRESRRDEASGRVRSFRTPAAAMLYFRRKLNK